MTKRGRVSTAALATAPITGAVETVTRPDAPYDLTDRQTAIWWAVVNRLPADWFPRETQDVLAQYCRHVAAAERVAQLILQTETEGDTLDLTKYEMLLRMQAKESGIIASLATKMRLTQQSTRSTFTRKPAQGKRPWE